MEKWKRCAQTECAVEAVSRMKLTMNISSSCEDGSQGWTALDAGDAASSFSIPLPHENIFFGSGVVLL